jgi:hypothetical protein
MKVRHLKVERFRGIRLLDWAVVGDFVCLVGPGDSTKTTILDALDLVLSPRWNVQFEDADLFGGDPSEPIVITATVGCLPDALKSEAKFGYQARGWDGTRINDEPEDADEPVLSIELRVDASLEPRWSVVNDRNPEGKPIGARDREKLGCGRLGAVVDRHFSWGRGAALARLTEGEDGVTGILAGAARTSRAAIGSLRRADLEGLHAAADRVKDAGAALGVAPITGYRPHLDPLATSVGTGALSLHDGEVPFRRAGLGTRRLLAMAMQRELIDAGALTLVDEVEHGLEPFRLRHLLRCLADPAYGRGKEGETEKPPTLEADRGQVIATTHSAITVGELNAEHLRVVRSAEGVTDVRQVGETLQPTVRACPEAFLGRKIIVCEGKTEIGVCRRMDEWWGRDGQPFALRGVVLADGGGEQAAARAKGMAELGYTVSLFGDSDKDITPNADDLAGAGVHVALWAGGMAIEERLCADLPQDGVVELVQLVMSWREPTPVRDAVRARVGEGAKALGGDPTAWWSVGIPDDRLRAAIGETAKHKKQGWFKRVDLAEQLAGIVVKHWDAIETTETGRTLIALREWAQSGGSS